MTVASLHMRHAMTPSNAAIEAAVSQSPAPMRERYASLAVTRAVRVDAARMAARSGCRPWTADCRCVGNRRPTQTLTRMRSAAIITRRPPGPGSGRTHRAG
uniref:Uncharacterized protein n=1 Tax=Ralstonia syzygii R24 TaxID=907261 RepID=G3AAE8_9RALS|nr:hypothetical protein RALSY_mp10402 [Ralstonia syzygii R24]